MARPKVVAAWFRSPSAYWTSARRGSAAGRRLAASRATSASPRSVATARHTAARWAALGNPRPLAASHPPKRISSSTATSWLGTTSWSFPGGETGSRAACSTDARADIERDRKLASSRRSKSGSAEPDSAGPSSAGPGRPAQARSIQRRSRRTANPASPADPAMIRSRTSAGGSLPALRRASSATDARDNGPSRRLTIPDQQPSGGRSHGNRTKSRPLGGLPTSARASSSSSGEPVSKTQRGRAEARCSRSATKEAKCARASAPTSPSSPGSGMVPVEPRRARSSQPVVSSRSIPSRARESMASRASRITRLSSACRPEPIGPVTQTRQTLAAPCANSSR